MRLFVFAVLTSMFVGLSVGSAFVEGNPGDVTPREATVLEILTNADTWQASLISIKDAILSGSSTFAGEVTVTDASGSMVLFTRNDANFSSSALPSGMVTLTALLSEFDTPNLVMRNISDVKQQIINQYYLTT